MFSQGMTDVLLSDAFMINFCLEWLFLYANFLVSSSLLRCAEFSPVRH